MADIELVIKINEDDVHRIVSGFTNEDDAVLFANLLNNGTLLPKGHGNLKDADEIKKNQFTLGTSNYCEYKVVKIEDIDKADTIIKADNAESEEKKYQEAEDKKWERWEKSCVNCKYEDKKYKEWTCVDCLDKDRWEKAEVDKAEREE